MTSDLEIAKNATLCPIEQIAEKLQITPEQMECYGRYKAKVPLDVMQQHVMRRNGKLILVTAITPTPAGEGKTTTSIGLADGLNRIGKNAVVCLREPSLGPCFGMKGGATGGGYAQVVPMEEINLHFTGDLHAITIAHNLLAAVLDNHLHHGNHLKIDTRRIIWNRVLDLNDRALRHIVVGLGGPLNSVPRESGFDITVASEVMAVFCLSRSLTELKERLGKIIVAFNTDGKPVVAADLRCHGAMAALLKTAMNPNLVQTLEGTPAFVHGGPFANIAHGCNSVVATQLGLKLADYVVTEAGFGADLGAQKFFDIKCPTLGTVPSAVVVVATVRALKMHGGVVLTDLNQPNTDAVERGFANLQKHLENIQLYGFPAIVAINSFPTDTDEEVCLIETLCHQQGVEIVRADHWQHGGAGAMEMAQLVVEASEAFHHKTSEVCPLYDTQEPILKKIEMICKKIYGAAKIVVEKKTLTKITQFEELGFGTLPVCMAKTQYSFSADSALKGRPVDFEVPIRDVKIAAGAGFVVVYAGDIMTMPGLSKSPASEQIDIDENGAIIGLF